MKIRVRRSVYLFGVISLFLTASLFTYQNFAVYYVELNGPNNLPSNPLKSSVDGADGNVLEMVLESVETVNSSSHLHSDESKIWPDPNKPWKDRILKQMSYVPSTYSKSDRILQILCPGGLGDNPRGQSKFLLEECPVNRCSLTDDLNERLTADAVVFQNDYIERTPPRGKNQVWILWLLESPLNSFVLKPLADQLNWTATYRSDSDIVAPYAKFVPFDKVPGVTPPRKDYYDGKSKAVAWFVSNCYSQNERFQYAIQLQRYIQVDIYGACGTLDCPRFSGTKCFDKLRQEYLFYLSFENSNCNYYITEKFFINALENDVVPVVMGGRKEDYTAVAPPGSFIHIDDFQNISALADYLKQLSTNPKLYNQYFQWKGTGQFINTKFWCRVCAMLHAVIGSGRTQMHRRGDSAGVAVKSRSYSDVEQWWRNNKTCTKGAWSDKGAFIAEDEWKEMLGPW